MLSWLETEITGDVTEIPQVGASSANAMLDEGVTTTWQLFGVLVVSPLLPNSCVAQTSFIALNEPNFAYVPHSICTFRFRFFLGGGGCKLKAYSLVCAKVTWTT
jgi:hypothetical protein